MIEEDFYATVKLTTGEEIFAKVAPTSENGETFLLISNPVVISYIKKNDSYGYKFEPWIKTSNEDFYILNLKDIVLISESSNQQIIKLYNMFISEYNDLDTDIRSSRIDNNKLSKKMGYIANINEAKILLEKIFKDS